MLGLGLSSRDFGLVLRSAEVQRAGPPCADVVGFHSAPEPNHPALPLKRMHGKRLQNGAVHRAV